MSVSSPASVKITLREFDFILSRPPPSHLETKYEKQIADVACGLWGPPIVVAGLKGGGQ